MINRRDVVMRHHPKYKKVESLAPLSVGNGRFAFSADITGLQTFPEDYKSPLGIQSEWAWHSTNGKNLYKKEQLTKQKLDTYGEEVEYPLYPYVNEEEAYHWLRQNPHRVQLGKISFRLLKEDNKEASLKDLYNMEQELNLWEGELFSTFYLENKKVSVRTVCHPDYDEIGVYISSPLLALSKIQITLSFPSPDMTSIKWEESIYPNGHSLNQVRIVEQSRSSVVFHRQLDQDSYEIAWSWSNGQLRKKDLQEFILVPDSNEEEVSFSISFREESPYTHSYEVISSASKKHWEQFWNSGGAIDFSGSLDPRAYELERRVVLSQFLTAIHGRGTVPPQETGYMYNSWFGKFHLEMHWWHIAHFALWGRETTVEKAMDWYVEHLSIAKDLALEQGYEGARWPKMIGIDGEQSPSPIAPLLIWQQPHPIALAELCYQANPKKELLEKWEQLIIETADFMTSFAVWDEVRNSYVLGPPLIPAQECHNPVNTLNPPYELEYWKYGLEVANEWISRLGKKANPKWLKVAGALSKPPHADGVYLAHENCETTFTDFNHDHPSMVGALGILEGTLINSDLMKQTLDRVEKEWQWETAWGWDFPMCAMTAARLGDSEKAVQFLLMDQVKNTYLPNGHNYQNSSLTCYLPGNGGLLIAVAMMACGWRGNENQQIKGFPQDGTWQVRWEGLHPIL